MKALKQTKLARKRRRLKRRREELERQAQMREDHRGPLTVGDIFFLKHQ